MLAGPSFFEGYDLNVVMVALPAIRHSFGLTQAQASGWIALLFLGALPAVFFARRADRHGRRRLLLASIAGYTVATAATALAPDIVVFGICQLCARAFLAVEVTLTWTVLAEELPAGKRGYGFGVLAMLDALGAGAGALAWGLLLVPHHLSWRLLYVAAGPALLAVVFIRAIPESSRFTAAASALGFFLLARGAPSLFAALAVTYAGQFGAWPTLSGLTTELFPTSQRALARSTAGGAGVIGQCGSFLLAAVLVRLTGSLALAAAALAVGPASALAIVATKLPETAGRELEEASAEPAHPAP
jgi:predicted MFS family arabinose efflux permease